MKITIEISDINDVKHVALCIEKMLQDVNIDICTSIDHITSQELFRVERVDDTQRAIQQHNI